ncbi:hypothetical protein [Reichenbachiella sp.]|uniref:hypothetical protein n=1 Tax=Reichenbachiella sp. TaxID=2184521 RepID=UPI003B591017
MPGKFETTTVNNYNHWINYMFAELIDDASVFVCPTLNDEDNFNPAGGDNTIFEASYIMNLIRPGNWAAQTLGVIPINHGVGALPPSIFAFKKFEIHRRKSISWTLPRGVSTTITVVLANSQKQITAS